MKERESIYPILDRPTPILDIFREKKKKRIAKAAVKEALDETIPPISSRVRAEIHREIDEAIDKGEFNDNEVGAMKKWARNYRRSMMR